MAVGLATALLYVACVGFYHAGARRTAFPAIKESALLRRLVWAGAALTTALALIIIDHVEGLERGIPIWLGLLTATGVASLLVSALAPQRHIPSAIVALIGAVLFALGTLIVGDAA